MGSVVTGVEVEEVEEVGMEEDRNGSCSSSESDSDSLLLELSMG